MKPSDVRNSVEFKSFSKIENIKKLRILITQKIHGSNAQIVITENSIQVGSRNRWITPEDDNYGFAAFVNEHKEEFINKLGVGVHFGEWAGPGINSGEGLSEKTLILFDFWKHPPEKHLPPRTKVVPILYDGAFDSIVINSIFEKLKVDGSSLVPGYMKPEGIVVTIGGIRYKKVFEDEETGWKSDQIKPKTIKEIVDYSNLLQPVRLEKLLSKDSRYMEQYPATLSTIVKDYIQDLLDEGCVVNEDIKALTPQVYRMVKELRG